MLDNFKKDDWTKFRTCSRVTHGPCVICKNQTYFGGWRATSSVTLLCYDCYDKRYEPDQYAAKIQAIKDSEAERLRLVANPPPGSKRTENGTLLGPIKYLLGVPVRQVLQEGSYDSEPYAPPGKELEK